MMPKRCGRFGQEGTPGDEQNSMTVVVRIPSNSKNPNSETSHANPHQPNSASQAFRLSGVGLEAVSDPRHPNAFQQWVRTMPYL